MLPPNALDLQGSTPRDASTRALLSETLYAEMRPEVAMTITTATTTTMRHILEKHGVTMRCGGHEEFDETIRTVSEPECSRRRIESTTGGSTRSVDGRHRQALTKGSASLQSLLRRRSRRHGGAGTSLPLETELSSRQAVYPVTDLLVKDSGGAMILRNGEEETRTATPTSTLIYATSSTAQPSTSRDNNVQDVSSSASNVATTTTSNVTSTTTNGGRFGNAGTIPLLRTTNVATPGPSTSASWNNAAVGEQESDYVVDPVQGNAYYKGHFLGKASNSSRILE